MPNGTTLTTQAGVAFGASNPDNRLVVEAPGAFGDPGDATTDILVSDIQSPQTISISFGTAIADVGAYVQWGGGETATYTLSAYGAGNKLLDTVSVQSDPSGDWAFVGVSEPAADIDAITFTLTGETPPHSAALGDLFLRETPVAAPEPDFRILNIVLLVGLAGVSSVYRRRKRPAPVTTGSVRVPNNPTNGESYATFSILLA